MGFFSSIGKAFGAIGNAATGGLFDLAGSAINAGMGVWQNSQNKAMMREQMAYGTAEREASQAWQDQQRLASQEYQTSERKDQNAFSEEMYNKYQSPEAMAEQYRAAGLDPRLAMGSGSAGSVSASSGSSGGAPSSGAPAGRSVTPPYQDITSASQGFVNMANALRSIAEAKKVGVDTDLLQASFDEHVASDIANYKLQELQANTEKMYTSEKAHNAWMQMVAELKKKNKEVDVLGANLKILVHEGVIKKNVADHWLEQYKANLENLNADTANKNADTSLKSAQTELTKYMSQTERTKPALNRALTSLNEYQSEIARVSSEIAVATEYGEVQAIRARNSKVLEHIEAEIKSLNAQAELALRNKDYSTWDMINGSINAFGSLGYLFVLGKNAFKRAAPVLSAPAGAFSPQFNNPSDLNTYGQGTNIWY